MGSRVSFPYRGIKAFFLILFSSHASILRLVIWKKFYFKCTFSYSIKASLLRSLLIRRLRSFCSLRWWRSWSSIGVSSFSESDVSVDVSVFCRRAIVQSLLDSVIGKIVFSVSLSVWILSVVFFCNLSSPFIKFP